MRRRSWLHAQGTAGLALVFALARSAGAHHDIGTDLASLNLCLYGDCEARGTYAADPYGLYNPGVLAGPTLEMLPRGVAISGSYFHLDIGGVDTDIEAGVATLAWAPVVFQVATVYAEAHGPVHPLPGVDMRFRTRAIRLAAGIDLDATLGLDGLSVGLAGVIPDMHSDLHLTAGGRTIARSTETRDVELIPGALWRTGERDWLMLGAFVDATRNHVDSAGLDPATGQMLRRSGTTNLWFARAGLSALPFVPLGLASDATASSRWLGELRVGVDVEYRNLSVPNEPGERGAVGFFGADAPLLPASLNPLSAWLRPWVLGGVDTRGGWGAGLGLYGEGLLRFAGCNGAYSQRPLTAYLGDRVEAIAVTCSVMLPL